MAFENEGAPAPADAPVASEPVAEPAVADAPAEAPQDPDAVLTDELQEIWDKTNADRDDAGRFVSKQVSTDQSPAKTEAKTDVPSVAPPSSWSAEKKAIWSTLSPEAQAHIADREKQASDALSRQGQQIKALEPIRSVLDQHKDVFERNGINEADGIAALLAAQRELETNAPVAIQKLANMFGVDLRMFGGQDPNGQQQALLRHIAGLEAKLNDTTNRIQSREQQEEAQQFESMEQQVAAFSKDKADWPELENDVLSEIIGLKASIQAGITPEMQPDKVLSLAYERAQRNNPQAWAKKQAADKAAEEKARIEEAQKRTKDARRSAPLSVGKSVANASIAKSIDDTLNEVARKHYG